MKRGVELAADVRAGLQRGVRPARPADERGSGKGPGPGSARRYVFLGQFLIGGEPGRETKC